MPALDQRNTLPEIFAKPAGETDGPQVFELVFDVQCERVQWESMASRVARKIGINFKAESGFYLRRDIPWTEAEKILYVAMESGADYQLLNNAINAEFHIEEVGLDKYYEELLTDFEEDDKQHVSMGLE
jgi:ABC-type Na+ transport system ATPase subunit NatA